MKDLTKKIYDIPLHDIKDIVEVQEYSFYYFLGTLIFALVVFGALAYLLYKYIQKRNAYNQRKEHYKLLQGIDLQETKKAAYAITDYGYIFKDDGERQAGMYANIVARLEQYKYKKSVDAFDDETLGYIELYKGMIDV